MTQLYGESLSRGTDDLACLGGVTVNTSDNPSLGGVKVLRSRGPSTWFSFALAILRGLEVFLCPSLREYLS